MRDMAKPLILSVLIATTLMAVGCDRFSRSKAPERSPAKLVKLDQQIAVLDNSTSFTLPKSGKRFGGNNSVTADLQIAHIDGVLIAASHTGVVAAFRDATQLWSVNVEDVITSGVAVGQNLAVVGTRTGKIIAIDAKQGTILWQKPLPASSLAPALIAGEYVMVSGNDGIIYALHVRTGEQIWQFSTQNPHVSVRGMATPIMLDEMTAVFGTADGRIHAINPKSGTPLWTRRIGRAVGGSQVHRMSDVDGTPLVVGNHLYVGSFSGQLAGFNLNTGETMFISELATTKQPAVVGDVLVGSSVNGEVVAFNRLNGEQLWKSEVLKYRRLTNPVVVGDYIAVGDFEGVVHLFDKTGKVVSRVQTKGQLTNLQVIDNHLYAQTTTDVVNIWQIR